MFAYFRAPTNVTDLVKRTLREILEDNCLGLAAQLAFYFLLALFPALIFLVALIGFLPVEGLMAQLLMPLSRFAPPEVLNVIRTQLAEVAAGDDAGLLTLGIVGAIWSSSAAMMAIIDMLNRAYDVEDRRPWWKRRVLAMCLTVALAVFVVIGQTFLQLGPWLFEVASSWIGIDLGPLWSIARWGLTLLFTLLAIDLVYYFAPDAETEWTWLTPGSLLATGLWLAASMGFRVYVQTIGDVSATYGTLGGVIVVMLWFYVSGLAILVGAELNAEIDHASAYRSELKPRGPGEKSRIGAAAERVYEAKLRKLWGQTHRRGPHVERRATD